MAQALDELSLLYESTEEGGLLVCFEEDGRAFCVAVSVVRDALLSVMPSPASDVRVRPSRRQDVFDWLADLNSTLEEGTAEVNPYEGHLRFRYAVPLALEQGLPTDGYKGIAKHLILTAKHELLRVWEEAEALGLLVQTSPGAKAALQTPPEAEASTAAAAAAGDTPSSQD